MSDRTWVHVTIRECDADEGNKLGPETVDKNGNGTRTLNFDDCTPGAMVNDFTKSGLPFTWLHGAGYGYAGYMGYSDGTEGDYWQCSHDGDPTLVVDIAEGWEIPDGLDKAMKAFGKEYDRVSEILKANEGVKQ